MSNSDSNELKLSDADQVCIQGAYPESWMYIVTDKEFLAKTVEIFDNLDYEESDKAVNMMNAKEVFRMSFSKGNAKIKDIIVDKDGLICFEAGTQSYQITSDFDFEKLKTMIYQETKEIKEANDAALQQQEKDIVVDAKDLEN